MYLECCSKEQLNNIYNEFNITEESLAKDVDYLIDWMEKQPHLPNITDRQYLSHFLVRCKNSLEKAKRRLDQYYTTRATLVEVFTNRNPGDPAILESGRLVQMTPLPKLTPKGQRVMVIHFNNVPDCKTSAEIMLRGVQMTIDVMVKNDDAIDYIIIHDFHNITVPVITIGFSMMKTFIHLSTKNSPVRINKLYYVNVSPKVEPLINLSKPLLPKKISEKFDVWSKKASELCEILPKEILPSTYGGTEKPIIELGELWAQHMQEHKDWLLAEESIKADLSKRPNDGGFSNELGQYGVEGSFRKIALD